MPIDNGGGGVSEDLLARRMLVAQGSRCAAGLGCLVIVPVKPKPPSEPVRKALKAALAVLPLRCMRWLVESDGFQASMVRDVLTGLRLVASASHATHVSRDLEEAHPLDAAASRRWRRAHRRGVPRSGDHSRETHSEGS